MRKELIIKSLTVGGVLGACAVAWAANCNIDVPAKCHSATTNFVADGGLGHFEITSDGFSTKCVSTNASGGDACNSVTNDCVFQEWTRFPFFGDGKKFNKTNEFDTTASGGHCSPDQ